MQSIPLRNKYKLKIPTPYGDYYLEFMQATAKETLEFNERKEDRVGQWVQEVILKGKCDTKRRQFRKKKKIMKFIADNAYTIAVDCIKKSHKSYDTLYGNIKAMPKKQQKPRRWLLGANMQNVCKEWNIGWLNELLDEYTWEQVEYMMEMLKFNTYEQFDEWKVANDRMFTRLELWSDQDVKKIIKENREKRKNAKVVQTDFS